MGLSARLRRSTGAGRRPARAAEPAGLAARRAAQATLSAVLGRGVALDDALPRAPGFAALVERDRAFARIQVATALRRLGEIDAVLARCLARALPGAADPVRQALRLGICQLLFLGTPAHAAVDGAVRLLSGSSHAGFRGLVNAVLRRVARDGARLAEGLDAARVNTPDWLWESWTAAYGAPTCRRIAEAHLAEPPLDFSVKTDAPGWAERLDGAVLPTGSVRRRHGGPVFDLPGYDEGAWWVQDAAAALPARLLLSALGMRAPGAAVADLCAAPGGKTAQLAAAGARVTSVERAQPRRARLAENLRRLRLEAELVAADAETWRPERVFDAVLLDAPCTATGTIRRHPDIARLKSPADVARLAPIQDRLLDAAAALVAPGGLLVYAVCSLQPEEGAARVAAFLARTSGFARLPIAAAEIGGLAEALTGAGELMTLPCHLAESGGLDGFYAARLVRRPPTTAAMDHRHNFR